MLRSRLSALVAGVAVAVTGWAVADALVDDLAVAGDRGRRAALGVGPVVGSTIAGVAAGAVLQYLARSGGKPRRRFLELATIGLVASFVPPMLNDTNTASQVVLEALHVAVAVAVIPIMARALPRSREPAKVE